MFGRGAKLPIDISLNLPTASLTADDMLTCIKRAFDKAESNLIRAQARQMERFDRGLKDADFRVDDLVLYGILTRQKGIPDKLKPKCKGPYKVKAKLSDLSYIIELLNP